MMLKRLLRIPALLCMLALLFTAILLAGSLTDAVGIPACGVVCGDLREVCPRDALADLAVSNPPYFPRGSGAEAENPARRTARTEGECTLEDILRAAQSLLRWGGRLALVFRPERMAELMTLCRQYGLEPKRLRMVHNTAQSAPSLLLLECRRGGKTGLRVDAPLMMTNSDGSPTADVDAAYFRNKR